MKKPDNGSWLEHTTMSSAILKGEFQMKKIMGGAAAIVAMMALGMGGASAASVGGGFRGAGADPLIVRVDDDRCLHLKRECHEEKERGEYDGPVCYRFQRECEVDDHCGQLSHECREAKESGDYDSRVCHRYHEECAER
jgi:hypothetical protein